VTFWAGGLLVLGFISGPAVTVVGVVLIGVGMTTASQVWMFLLQDSLPPQVMGRGFTAAAVLLYAGDAIGLAVFGGLVDHVAVTTLIAAGGVLMGGSVLVQWVLARCRTPTRNVHVVGAME
jgi:hypothetical protein